MIILNITTNQQQQGIRPKGGALWECGHDTPQKFVVKIKTEERDVGKRVGLIQQIIKTDRVAHFTGGGRLAIIPRRDPPVPVLDADDVTIPFYNQFSQITGTVEQVNQEIVLTLEDSPYTQLESNTQHGGKQQSITKLEVEEIFIIALCSIKPDGSELINQRQWKWLYEYELIPNGSVYAKPSVVSGSDVTTRAEDTDYSTLLILGPPVATENPRQEWTWTT